jgi:hypothetical protein
MKPLPQVKSQHQRNFPQTDFSYQATETNAARSTITSPPSIRSVWKLSAEYFAGEATRDYLSEAILFVCISAIAAWPIAVMLRQLTRWMI